MYREKDRITIKLEILWNPDESFVPITHAWYQTKFPLVANVTNCFDQCL